MSNFSVKFDDLVVRVVKVGQEVEVGEWQSQDVRDKPEFISRELRHEVFKLNVEDTMEDLQRDVKPNLPWAEDHFRERVSGQPMNPPPSEAWWPYRVRQNEDHKAGEIFSHTYPERIWPKYANKEEYFTPHRGIRYEFGDLDELITLLVKNPLTRQAYLPIWFPEDTGATSGQRVPCTLGYQFLIRNGRCDIVYYIRSCDLLRHFTDDVYMACRLLQWVVGKLLAHRVDVMPGWLVMYISSLHVFRGDYPRLEYMMDKIAKQEEGEQEYGAAV